MPVLILLELIYGPGQADLDDTSLLALRFPHTSDTAQKHLQGFKHALKHCLG